MMKKVLTLALFLGILLLPEAAFIVAAGDVDYPERASHLSMQFNQRLAQRVDRRTMRVRWHKEQWKALYGNIVCEV